MLQMSACVCLCDCCDIEDWRIGQGGMILTCKPLCVALVFEKSLIKGLRTSGHLLIRNHMQYMAHNNDYFMIILHCGNHYIAFYKT